MKVAMDLVGLTGGPVRPPLPSLRPEEREELAAMMKSWASFL